MVISATTRMVRQYWSTTLRFMRYLHQADVGILQGRLTHDHPPHALAIDRAQDVGHRLRPARGLDQQHLLLVIILHGQRIHKGQAAQLLQGGIRYAKGLHLHHVQVLHVGLQSAGRIQGDDAAVVDDRDAVAQRIGFEHVMGGQQDGLLFRLQVQDHLAELARPDRVQAEGGFIQEQDVRVVQQRARHVQALLHAAGIALHLLIAAPGQPDHLEQVGDALLGDVGVDVIQAGEVTQVVDARRGASTGRARRRR